MALTDTDLEGMTLVTERKPEKAGGVTVSHIPAPLVALLEQEAPKALKDKDYELILRVPVRHAEDATAEDKAKAHATAISTMKQLVLYSAAWGKGQTPKLRITKVPNRRDDKDTPMARLKVENDEEVPAENRPGRRR